MKKIIAVAALAALPVAANAELLFSAEAFGSFSTHEQGAILDEDSDGFGLRGRVNLPGTGLFIRGEYLDEELDNGVDYKEKRLGGGISYSFTPLLDFTGEVQYIDVDHSGISEDGYGLFAGVEASFVLLTLYGRAGLGWLDDSDLTELLLGARIGIGLIGLFAEYRMLTMEPDNNAPDLDIDSFRVGVRVAF